MGHLSFHPHGHGRELAESISFSCLVNLKQHRASWSLPEARPTTVELEQVWFRDSYNAKIRAHDRRPESLPKSHYQNIVLF